MQHVCQQGLVKLCAKHIAPLRSFQVSQGGKDTLANKKIHMRLNRGGGTGLNRSQAATQSSDLRNGSIEVDGVLDVLLEMCCAWAEEASFVFDLESLRLTHLLWSGSTS